MQHWPLKNSDVERAISDVMGMMMSVMITVTIFIVFAVGVIAIFGLQESSAHVVVQGAINDTGDGIEIIHFGGDPVPMNAVEVTLFVNESLFEITDISFYDSNYQSDTDGKWNFSDRFVLDVTIGNGSQAELNIIDTRTHNLIGYIIIIT